MKTAPAFEFSRPLPVDRVPPGGCTERIYADPAECEALATRLKLPGVHDVRAQLTVIPWRGGGLKVTGRVDTRITQTSVISLEDFRSDVRFDVESYFLPPGAASEDDDAGVIDHGVIDLGEIATETIALELDPYPRKEGEEFRGLDVDSEQSGQPRPSATIADLASRFNRK